MPVDSDTVAQLNTVADEADTTAFDPQAAPAEEASQPGVADPLTTISDPKPNSCGRHDDRQQRLDACPQLVGDDPWWLLALPHVVISTRDDLVIP
jgi:hypothetical protein